MTDPKEPSVLDNILINLLVGSTCTASSMCSTCEVLVKDSKKELAQAKSEILKHFVERQEVEKAFAILEKGHGGGNFRRLINQAKERLGI